MPTKKYFRYKSCSYGLANFKFFMNHATLFYVKSYPVFVWSFTGIKFTKTNSQNVKNLKYSNTYFKLCWSSLLGR